MDRKVRTIDDYLAPLSDDKREALAKLRSIIQATVPKAEECITHETPAFCYEGEFLVGFGATERHCSLYPTREAIASRSGEPDDHDALTGTILFEPRNPLPTVFVKRLVRTRLREIISQGGGKRRMDSQEG